MKAIVTHETGGPEILKIEQLDDPVPSKSEILVQVHAAGLNNADLLQRRGMYPAPAGASPILGMEIAGIVLETGSSVKRWKKGDLVMALLSGGGYAEKAVLHESQAMPVPTGMSPEDAAAIPEVFLTAYLELVTLGNIKSGESVLIHAGASGVGTAAIQVARELGTKIFVTASSERKLERCRELGADITIDYKNEAFDERILKETAGRGVDCILDLVGAAHWNGNIRALATDGRLLLVGLSGGAKVEVALGPILAKRLRIIGSTLRARTLEDKARLIEEFVRFSTDRFAGKKLKPVVDRVFPFAQVVDAHRYLESRANVGKVILSLKK